MHGACVQYKFQVVKAAAINLIGGAGNTAGATLHSFGGQTIVTGNSP